ncbi:hypothetical protein EDC01DRAFT_745341 [Geopyxis carbonaria]|nr:hypothetical protein EDC01DRAFT_745341 [Geopyxis carbonaria]
MAPSFADLPPPSPPPAGLPKWKLPAAIPQPTQPRHQRPQPPQPPPAPPQYSHHQPLTPTLNSPPLHREPLTPTLNSPSFPNPPPFYHRPDYYNPEHPDFQPPALPTFYPQAYIVPDPTADDDEPGESYQYREFLHGTIYPPMVVDKTVHGPPWFRGVGEDQSRWNSGVLDCYRRFY